jgi:PilZ domain
MAKFGKRRDGPGGRRHDAREPVLLAAALMALGSSRTVYLVDVSKTGCQLRISEPLLVGQEVWLKIQPADIFGTVVWVKDEHCGIAFDVPFADEDVALLQTRGKVILIPRLTPEEQMAAAEWSAGLAR